MSPNEARTRQEHIDPALKKAGWDVHDSAQVGIEILVDGYDAEPWNGITDYCLYRPRRSATHCACTISWAGNVELPK